MTAGHMSAWTDGKIHVVLGPAGLSVHRGDDVELLLTCEQLGGELPTPKGLRPRLRPLAVPVGLEAAFTINAERKLVRTPLGSKQTSLVFPWDISALATATGGQVFAAYVTGTKARALTSIVLGSPPADPKSKWEHEYESDKPQKVEWPDQLLWEKAPWSRKTRWTVDPNLLEIDANAHAYTVYDTDSAVVGVLRRPGPKQPPVGFACVLRTPMDVGSTVFATATARGVLVATSRGDGQSVICEFDDKGKMLRHRLIPATRLGPISLAGTRVFVVVDDRELLVLDHALAEQAKIDLVGPAGGKLDGSQLQLRPSDDGGHFVLASHDKILHGSPAGSSWTIRALDLSKVPSPGSPHEVAIAAAEIAVPVEPIGTDGHPIDNRQRIIAQAPGFSLDPNQPNDAWTFQPDLPFELVLNAVSVGGAAETGLYVEVSGGALEKGLIEPELVEIEGRNRGRASFEVSGKKRIARLPQLLIPAGVEPNKDKKIKPKERFLENPEDTFVCVRLRGKTRKLGSDLLYVRVGFSGTDEGSLMRGRPLTIQLHAPVVAPPPEAAEVAGAPGVSGAPEAAGAPGEE
jgi:hypothetical protein